ncbi:glucose-6-phosphate 3-dehydrogenase [Peptococcaceae bacterium CEB3]|nr:glucose-6-phosphate 3-dehydrogenase [Peptococcaceae bacterium CEB3]
MESLKVGVIGTGFIGPVHVEAIRRLGHVEVTAIAGVDQASADRAAGELGIPKAYADYRELLEDTEIVAVHNCTPNHLHYKVNRDSILAGKHLLSEKPLALSSSETSELLHLAETRGIVHGVNFNYRQYPLVQHLRSLIRSGELGAVRLIRGNYLQDWLSEDTDYNWRIEPQFGGPLRAAADIGSHWLDLVQHITGQRITEVFADLATVLPVRKRPIDERLTFSQAQGTGGTENGKDNFERVKVETEDYATLLLHFNGGAVGTVTVSQVTPGRKNHLVCEIDCSNSSVYWSQEESEKVWIGHRNRANELLMADPLLLGKDVMDYIHYPGGHNQGWPDALTNMMRQFYREVIQREQKGNRTAESSRSSGEPGQFATFADGHRLQCVLEAVLDSHRTRRWAKVSYLS